MHTQIQRLTAKRTPGIKLPSRQLPCKQRCMGSSNYNLPFLGQFAIYLIQRKNKAPEKDSLTDQESPGTI